MSVTQMLTSLSQPAETSYQVEVLTDIRRFEALAQEWNQLLVGDFASNIAFEHQWLLLWLNHVPEAMPFIVLVRNNRGKLAGAAPFKISRTPFGMARRLLRHLQFIGTEPCVYDWMQVLVLPGEDEAAIIREVARAVHQSRRLWDVIDLRYCANQTQLELLALALSSDCHSSRITPTMSMPYMYLPQKSEGYAALNLSKKFVKDLQRVQNGLKRDFPEEGPLTLQFEDVSDMTDVVMQDFFTSHIQYWAKHGYRSILLRCPALQGFYKVLFQQRSQANRQQGQVLFSTLRLGQRVLSYHLGFLKGESYLGYLSSYDTAFKKYRPGVLHMDLLVRHMIELEVSRFEFGRGDEGYKSYWKPRIMPMWNLLAFQNPLGQLAYQADKLLKTLLNREGA